ncbi:MAG TPA: rhomboid family intramembrane serine protease [Microlunatus sp.]
MSEPPHAGPGFAAPGFVGCYRHPDRMTGISCQRCHKPICGECMNTASVGFQCPKCVSSGRTRVREPRTLFGASMRPGGGRATIVVMGIMAAVWVLDLITRGLATDLLAMSNFAVAQGQFWRLVTASFTSGGLLGVLLNMLVLWLAGRAMEAALGSWRFVLLYLAAGLGGMTLFFLIAPWGSATVGATSAIVGLLAANAIGKVKTGEDIRGDVSLLVLLVLYAVLVGFASFGWVGLIGGIAVGALSGAILAYAPRDNRLVIQLVGILGVVVLCLAAVVAKIAVL